jgi:hypothetical protein
MINQFNFFKHTSAVFKGCKKPKRKADYISYDRFYLENYAEKIPSSYYWYGQDKNGSFVIRYSSHWVNLSNFTDKNVKKDCKNIASCIWGIKTNQTEKTYAGKAYFKDFKHL